MSDLVIIEIAGNLATFLAVAVSAYFSHKAKRTAEITHTAVNSRIDVFMKMAEKAFKAEGVLQEKADEEQRRQVRGEKQLDK